MIPRRHGLIYHGIRVVPTETSISSLTSEFDEILWLLPRFPPLYRIATHTAASQPNVTLLLQETKRAVAILPTVLDHLNKKMR